MNDDLMKKLAKLGKKAEGAMPPGMMPQGAPMDPMMGGAPMGGGQMGPAPVPTAEEIMAMQGGAPMGGQPMDPMMGGAPMAAPPMGMDPAMMGMDPAMMGAPMPPMPPAEPSPEQLAVDQANAEALSSMGQAVQGLTEVMAKQQASTTATMMNAADAIVASPVGDELVADDIGPLMAGDAI